MDSLDELDGREIYIEVEGEEITNYAPDMDTICTICNAEFLDPEDLNIHLDQVHKIARCVLKKCQLCPESYTDLMDYAEHIRDNHLLSMKCCLLCWRVFDDFDAHRIHRKKHIVPKFDSIYSCSQCPHKYDNLFSLRKHEYEHFNSRDGVFMYEVFPYLSAALKVKFMSFISSLDTDVVYVCVGCGFTSVDMNMYLRHVRLNKCEVSVCDTCGYAFKGKNSLSRHVQGKCNMFGEREKKTQLCVDCNTNVDVCMYSKHKNDCKPIKCHTCNVMFQTVNEWSDHLAQEHSSHIVEVETCQFCLKRCVGKVAMEKHIDKTHRPFFHLYKYLCIYCKDVFNHPQKLFAHFFTKHKDILPYTCKICNKKFRFRKKFTIHIKLEHKSVGFVEFSNDYHVFFTDKKSEHPFVPKSLYIDETKTSGDERHGDIVALNSDCTDAIETESNQTAATTKTKTLKRKRVIKTRKQENEECISIQSSDDDEPLMSVRKKVRLQKKRNLVKAKQQTLQTDKRALTCNICKKYCYTVQNYYHHVSLHSRHEGKRCIKCSKIFKTKLQLQEHVDSQHSSSRLTETLKVLLEKRKIGSGLTEGVPTSIKFQRTLIKAKTNKSTTSAKITAVDHKLSVKNFLENFVPEDSKDYSTESTATIRLVKGYTREPSVKLTKYKESPSSTSKGLAMPVKFVDNYPEKTKVSVKIVNVPCKTTEVNEYYTDHDDNNIDIETHESIPEVAAEVMLENTEEQTKEIDGAGHKVMIPKLPDDVGDMRIAHLLPDAPYYKIVKVKDVLAEYNNKKEKKEENNKPPPAIKLQDGTKFVTTNPLAHLLGKNEEKLLQSMRNKYYKSKNQNVAEVVTKALTMLVKPSYRRKKPESKIIKIEEDSDD